VKICIISSESNYREIRGGGGFISVRIHIESMSRLGHDVVILSKPNPDIMRDADIVWHHNIKNLVMVQHICEKLNLPLVVTVNSFITCPMAAHIRNEDPKYGKPCERCSLKGVFTCLLLNKQNQNRKITWKAKMRKFSFLLSPFYYYNMKLRLDALNKANRIICISPTLMSMLKKAGIDENKMIVIPQPVDPSYLNPPRYKLFYDRVALFVGAASWIKGAHLAAEAVSKLCDVKLAFVGGITVLKPYIEKLLGKRAIFVGSVPAEEMKKYYYSAHIVLFPSIWYEAFGRVWAESCMCGTPVVAFKGRGGASDYLKHEKTALLSDYDVDEYAEQIKRLFEDEALYKKISRNAREYAKKNFSADVVAKKYEKVFEEVLNERDDVVKFQEKFYNSREYGDSIKTRE